jgi:hypothetical protein
MGSKTLTRKPQKQKMITLSQLAVGTYRWNQREEARLERNVFAFEGRTFEALRFCKYKNGRHTRVHLVISRDEFLELFQSAAENGVFEADDLERIGAICRAERERRASDSNPLLDVIGIGGDGTLSQNIDEQLYGEKG